jgi:thioredoxin reductase (NADPH)
VIIATGAEYNRLPLDRLAEFERVGVYYAATQAEAQACGAEPVAVVGGGNSADQAALFLETSTSGIFALGDVRSGSLKWVAAGIGEGSVAVRLVFDRASTW